MKTKILFITFIGLFLTSCWWKGEEEKVEVPVKPEIIKVEEATPPEVKEEEDVNPLSDYISDKAYNEGVEIFYGDEESMFVEDTDVFSGNQDELKAYIESRFKLAMLVTQNGINSAVVYYIEGGSENRTMVSGVKIIKIGEMTYFIKVFKDRIEIKQGKNGRAVPLYLRER